MGICLASATHRAEALAQCIRVSYKGTSDASYELDPVPDTSHMSLEDLLRIGIAEAQLATMTRSKRDRLQHLHTARGLLTAALRQCGQRDPDLCAHLLAVLLKLGEDAQVVQNLIRERGQQETMTSQVAPVWRSGLPPSSAQQQSHRFAGGGGGASSGEPHRPSIATGSPTSSPNSPSDGWISPQAVQVIVDAAKKKWSDGNDSTDSDREDHDIGRWKYDEMNEGLLEDPEDDCGDDYNRSPASGRATASSTDAVAAREASDVVAGAGSSLRLHVAGDVLDIPQPSTCGRKQRQALSTVQEAHEGLDAEGLKGPNVAEISSPTLSCTSSRTKWPPGATVSKTTSRSTSRDRSSPEDQSQGSAPSHGNPANAGVAGNPEGTPEEPETSPRMRTAINNDPLGGPLQRLCAYVHGQPPQVLGPSSSQDAPAAPQPHHQQMVHRHGGRHLSQGQSSNASQGTDSDGNGSGTWGRRCALSSGVVHQEENQSSKGWSPKIPGKSSTRHSRNNSKEDVLDTEPKMPAGKTSTWNKSDVGQWLRLIGFGEFVTHFAAQDVDGEVLLSLTSEELRGNDFAFSLGKAKKFIKCLVELAKLEKIEEPSCVRWSTVSSLDVRGVPFSSCDELPASPETWARTELSSARALPFNAIQQSPSKATVLDTLSLNGSAAPSLMPSPFVNSAMSIPDMSPPAVPADLVSVRVLNGVSGEEEARFDMRLQAPMVEQTFLSALDKQCQQHVGQSLVGLNWLSQAKPSERFERRTCDTNMAKELLNRVRKHRKTPTVLLLCTVPVRPPSELTATKIRIKNLTPTRINGGNPDVRVRLETSTLQQSHKYTVAFTHQWCNTTCTSQATLCGSLRSVECMLPRQMFTNGAQISKEGLYDVHLVVDGTHRSENRRTITIGSAESELSSSSTRSHSAGSFVPIGRN